jgi:hypothetical protein
MYRGFKYFRYINDAPKIILGKPHENRKVVSSSSAIHADLVNTYLELVRFKATRGNSIFAHLIV